MRHLAGLLSVAAIASAAFAPPAGADPAKSNGLVTQMVNCTDGSQLAITHGSGYNGWDLASGQHTVLAFIIFLQDGQPVGSHNFGVKNGMATAGLICSADEGNGQSIIVEALPVPPRGG
jgi:hypothetical protein